MALRNKRTGKEFSAEMGESAARFKQVLEQKLPEHIKDKAQQLVDKSFEEERYQDDKSSKWQGRKNDKEAGNARTGRRGLLVKTGKLIEATEAEVRGKDTVAIVINDPEASIYGQVHNEGLPAGKRGAFKMPQRQFMPIPGEPFPELDSAVEKFLDAEMDKIFKD